MAIFSAFLKSPPESPTVRSVPNGGLGGFVQLRGKEKKVAKTEVGKSETEGDKTDTASRQRKPPPPPIRVNSIDVSGAPIQSAPLDKNNDRASPAALWKISHPPVKSATGTAFIVAEVEVQDLRSLSSKLMWKDSAHPQKKQENEVEQKIEQPTEAPKVPSPVELPGSLLLPDRGYGTESKPKTPSSAGNRHRADSERQQDASSDKNPKPSTPALKEPRTKATRAKTSKQSKSSNKPGVSTEVVTPTQVMSPTTESLLSSDVNILSAEDLIRVLPKMKAKRLATEWLPAMEKEIGKYKGLLHMYSNRTEDLKNLLFAMKGSAGSCEKFAKAQADIDSQKLTDIQKLEQTEDELQEALNACGSKTKEIDIRAAEFQRLKLVLYQVVATLGGCIRNNLAFQLYHSSEGLSEEVVKVLRAYKQWDDHTLKTFPSLVPAELFENAEQKAADLQRQLVDCQTLIADQELKMSRITKAHAEMSEQLEQNQEEDKAQNEYTKKLEEEIATLRKHVLPPSEIGVPPLDLKRFDNDELSTEEISEDITTKSTSHADELEQRDSVIIEQTAIIEDLLKRVNEMRRQTGENADDSAGFSESTSGPVPQSFLMRSASGAGKKRFLGSRTLSKAMTPISRGMNNLMYPPEYLVANATGQSEVEGQRQNDLSPGQTQVPNLESLDLKNTSSISNERLNQPTTKKIPVQTPYPRESLLGNEQFKKQMTSYHSALQHNKSVTNPRVDIAELDGSSHARAEDAVPKKSRSRTDVPARRRKRDSLAGQMPSIASRLQLASEPLPNNGSIMQGLRNEQLPLRLLHDTDTMSKEEQRKSLSLISEKTEESIDGDHKSPKITEEADGNRRDANEDNDNETK